MGRGLLFRYSGEQGPWRDVIRPENYGREGTGTRDLGREFRHKELRVPAWGDAGE